MDKVNLGQKEIQKVEFVRIIMFKEEVYGQA